MILEAQGFNDTQGFMNGTEASRIKSYLMNESSTKQIDAVWMLHDASSKKCYLKTIYSNFEAIIGTELRGLTTIIITQCDSVMG